MKTVKILLVAAGLIGTLAECGVTNQLHSELTYSGVATTEASLDQFGIMPLGAMLSAINTSGLAGRYARMLSDYEATGILERDTMRQIAEAAGVRYLAKFNLGDFQQSRDKRLSIAGIRMFDTSRAIIRVHLEIWDGLTGEIAWQGNEELVYAREGVKEKPVSFSQVARMSADHLVLRVGDRWHLYYTATREPAGGNHTVKVVESDDLVRWREPRTVFVSSRTGTGGGPTESPFVVARDGRSGGDGVGVD